ncbi:MAG: putative diguanylate cyclase AdrA [Planctomycetes bacterium ADurb.Bin401]|nr:MAG: putative diguanylate cyclase AdrA [Planctomycetes bacterium ADurb.Bin401]
MQSKIIIDTIKPQPQVLLIGRADKTVIDIEKNENIKIENCRDIPEAISTFAGNQFDVIAINTEALDKNLTLSLRNLRQVNPDSKIFLLAQMWQEPLAAHIVAESSNGAKLLDDYYICPAVITTSKPPGEEVQPEGSPSQEHLERIAILERLVMEDELTGVKNRRYVREFLRQIIEHAKQLSLQVTLLIFDIDNFKQYNDLFGHPVGDNILKQAAVLMQKCCRKQDVVGRIGGDEFAVVFWNLPGENIISLDTNQEERRRIESEHPKQVINICERFRNEINKTDLPALGAEGQGTLTISGGLATFPRDGLTVMQLFEQADKALLEAKRSGKNRVYLVGSDSNQQS